jgi:ubiquinone/menaquinone biosynthesis C-methylase UbiE
MTAQVEAHYGTGGDLAARIAESLKAAGKDIAALKPEDLAAVDEFHVRGRKATLELAERMALAPGARVLDIGSGLGGPARTVAAATGAHVTGIDLTESFCAAAAEMSRWVGLGERVAFRQGDAMALPFEDASFDAAMTIHVAMNIAAKDAVYAEARRVLKPGGIFAVYDILQGEGGPVLFPVPWAREPSISHLASPAEMRGLLGGAGFTLLEESDSSAESLAWFQAMAARLQQAAPPVTFQIFLGADFPAMARNQVRNLAEDRIRTVAYICRASSGAERGL